MTQQTTSSAGQPPGLYLIPISDQWRKKFRYSVEEPLDLTQYQTVPPQLEGIDALRIWGTTKTDDPKKQAAIDEMAPGDYVLFYHSGEIIAGGTIRRVFENPDVGELIWAQPESRHIYTIAHFTTQVPAIERVWDQIGYEGRHVVRGFSRVADHRVDELWREEGSLESALFGEEKTVPTKEQVEREKTELAQTITSEPQLTDDEESYVETRRKARDSAFSTLVRETYDYACVICGKKRESPHGRPEVEAAHIYPKSEGGSDDVRNGIALCKLHHWAFDSGWISITDNHTVVVAKAPETDGYREFKQLEGESLKLPETEAAFPHPLFLEQHRKLNGFDDDDGSSF
ncbi:HNH endonuclease [Natrialbaceae archaeon A-CW1-1]